MGRAARFFQGATVDNHPTASEGRGRNLPPQSAGALALNRFPASQPIATKPLAAYRLGHGSRDVWQWNQLFCEMPCGALAEGIALTLAQLRADRVTLSDEIPPDVYEELGLVLDEFGELSRGFAEK